MIDMKKIFAYALRELLALKPLNKISVTDIARKCGVSRQTFYNYFNDIYGLLEWYFIQETKELLDEYSDIDNWEKGYIRIMNWALENKDIVQNTYRSIQHEYIEVFIYDVLYQYIIRVVEKESYSLNVNEDQKKFVAEFYTLAITACSLNWIRKGMKDNPEDIAGNVSSLIEGDFKKGLLKFSDKNKFVKEQQ